MTRFLRPGFVVPSGEWLWVVDAFQPVAAVLDPESGQLHRLVSWPQLPPPPVTNSPWRYGWRVLAADPGLWVQPASDGPVALIDHSGLVRAGYSGQLRLTAATPAGAWCGPPPRKRRKLMQRPQGREKLLCVSRNYAARTVTVDRPVGQLRTSADGLYLCVRADPTVRADQPPHWTEPDPGEVWLHLPTEAPLPKWITRAEHGDAVPPPRPEPLLPGNSGPGSPWHRTTELAGHAAAVAGGLRWHVGSEIPSWAEPPVLATGHDRNDGTERQRLSLGHGRPAAVTPWGDSLWIAIRQSRPVMLARNGPAKLFRVDARQGTVETVLPAESLDITDHCWPLPPQPSDVDSYCEYQRHALDLGDFTATSHRHDSPTGRDGLRSVRAELAGTWPDTTIQLRCTHADYPGLELVRELPIFDELGRQHPPEQAAHQLLETFDIGTLPPASEARHGQIHI